MSNQQNVLKVQKVKVLITWQSGVLPSDMSEQKYKAAEKRKYTSIIQGPHVVLR